MADRPMDRRFSPYDAREVDKPLSNCDALFSVLKCVVGTGCLAMPLAFYYAGYVGGLILTFFGIAVLIYGLQLLITCMVEASRRNMVGYMNFPDTMTYAISVGPKCCHCLAKCAGHFVNAILIFSHYGICVIYIVFVSVNIKQVVDSHSKEIDIRLYCFIVGILSVPLFLVRHLKYLVPTNIAANLLLYTGYACILSYFFQHLPPIQEINYFNTQIPLFLGILMFATSSVGVMLAIESQMDRPGSYLGWLGVLNRAAVIVTFTYMIFGFFGYWRYGKYCAASVTLNMPSDETLAQVTSVLIAIAVFLSFPLSGYVVVDIVCKQYIIKRRSFNNPTRVEYICRGVFVLACTVNAIAFPNLGPLVELLGAFTISLLNIVFPCWIEICLLYELSYGAGRWRLVKDIVMILFGLVVLGYGSYSAIVDMVHKYGKTSHTHPGLSNKIMGPVEINAQYDAATLDHPIVDQVTRGDRALMVQEFYL